MINTKYLLYISTCLLFSGNVQASDINLTYDSSGALPDSLALHTQLHTPELKPISSLENSVKFAAVCSVGGGGCAGLKFGEGNNSMDLNENVQCTDEGYVKTCPAGYVKDENNICPHSSSYFKCRPVKNTCEEGYSLTACNSSTQVQTASYTNEAKSTCYQCRDKTCVEGGYVASINSCQNGTSVSFANKTCYSNVTAKTCENGGYKSSIPTNNKCTTVNYCGKSCQSNCYQPTCEESGYLTSCPTNHTCTTQTSYSRTCYVDGGQPTCEAGGYKSGVPTNQVCTPVSYSGRTCYQNCYQPQCSAGGYLDDVPSGKSCNTTTYYGRTCYKDCSDDEVEITCQRGSILYQDKKCYSKTKKTPIAVVFDATAKRAIALNEVNNGPILGIMAAGYASSYAPAGVSGWQYPVERDLKGLQDIQGTLNTILSGLNATPINGCYISATPRSFPLTAPTAPNTDTSAAIDIQYKVVDLRVTGSDKNLRCLSTINGYTTNRTSYEKIRLVIPYGDGNCGSYKFTTTSQEICDTEVLNGNLCYKNCVQPTCAQGRFFTSCKSGEDSQSIPFYGKTCYRCSKTTKTCEDGGYYTTIQNNMLCTQNLDGTGTITYEGLTCYECSEKPTVGTIKPSLTETCEDHGYLTPGSDAACACSYGQVSVTTKSSSGSTLRCVRCGTYSECGGSKGVQCLKCNDDKLLAE